ncbi:MORN repeat-containing protein (plasmid) [Leptospira sp. WS60.C2]
MKNFLLSISFVIFLVSSCQTTRHKFWNETIDHDLTATCKELVSVTGKSGECFQNSCKLGICTRGDCKNGEGNLLFPEGSRYDGRFVEGEFQGKGTLKFCNGTVIEGNFQNGFGKGIGKVYFADGSKYQGNLLKNEPHGYGIWVSSDKTLIYEGDFANGERNGYGIMESSDGSIWQGKFKDDQLDGDASYKNKLYSLNGKWKKGKQIGEHQYQDRNGIGYVRFSDNGEVLESKTAEDLRNERLALQIFSKAMGPKSDLRNNKEFCNKLMYELADFVGSSKITGCSAQCRSACGNMWDINSKDGDRCERQCRLCWNVLEYEPNDCKSVSPYPLTLPDKI